MFPSIASQILRRRAPARPRQRSRRRVLGLVLALLAAGLIGPVVAGASPVIDEGNGNTTPGQPPECAECPEADPDELEPSTTPDETHQSHDCTWRVTGRLLVRDPTLDGVEDRDPIAGVKVKVSGRSSPGSYREWDTDETNSNGEFSVSRSGCGRRVVKVEAKFESDSDDLRVKGPDSPTWYELYESANALEASDIELNGEPFGPGYGGGGQGTSQGRTDAQTWIAFRKALDYLDEIGYPSLNDTVVNNPASLAPDGSWSDPITHGIHISPAHTNSLDTMLHELGHAWAYPREIGEGCLTTALSDGSTHDRAETPCAAINEGFAKFFSNKLELELNADGALASSELVSSVTPSTRAELISCTLCDSSGLPNGLVSLGSIETSEYGWDQVFRVLTSSDLTRQLFGPGFGAAGLVSTYTGPSCAGRGMPIGVDDLHDALRAFGDSSDKLDLQDADDPSVADLFDRAADRLPSFDSTDAIKYTNTIDPTLDVEPHEAYGC